MQKKSALQVLQHVVAAMIHNAGLSDVEEIKNTIKVIRGVGMDWSFIPALILNLKVVENFFQKNIENNSQLCYYNLTTDKSNYIFRLLTTSIVNRKNHQLYPSLMVFYFKLQLTTIV